MLNSKFVFHESTWPLLNLFTFLASAVSHGKEFHSLPAHSYLLLPDLRLPACYLYLILLRSFTEKSSKQLIIHPGLPRPPPFMIFLVFSLSKTKKETFAKMTL